MHNSVTAYISLDYCSKHDLEGGGRGREGKHMVFRSYLFQGIYHLHA